MKTEIGRCATCMNWDQWDEGVGNCRVLTKATKGTRCRVYDDSDPIATEIMFGCIHHESALQSHESKNKLRSKTNDLEHVEAHP